MKLDYERTCAVIDHVHDSCLLFSTERTPRELISLLQDMRT